MLTMEKGKKRKKETEHNIRPENPKSWIFDRSPYLQHLSLISGFTIPVGNPN